MYLRRLCGLWSILYGNTIYACQKGEHKVTWDSKFQEPDHEVLGDELIVTGTPGKADRLIFNPKFGFSLSWNSR